VATVARDIRRFPRFRGDLRRWCAGLRQCTPEREQGFAACDIRQVDGRSPMIGSASDAAERARKARVISSRLGAGPFDDACNAGSGEVPAAI